MADWRSIVACPVRLSTVSQTFLDNYASHGILTKYGTFTVQDVIGTLVPFELLPIRVKKYVTMMPLERRHFKTINSFQLALCNLYKYGYLPDIDKGMLAKQQHWRAYRKQWLVNNPAHVNESVKRHTETRNIWLKSHEDFRLHQFEFDNETLENEVAEYRRKTVVTKRKRPSDCPMQPSILEPFPPHVTVVPGDS